MRRAIGSGWSAIAFCAAAALAACGESDALPAGPPNVLLISIDALRADRLGAYGYQRPTSPFLDELAARGLLFENAFINCHGTTPSHTTILSGLHQETHRVGMDELTSSAGGVVRGRIPDDVTMVQELLAARGYTTIGVTDAGNASAAFGFSRGFDRFDDRGGGIQKVARRVTRLIREAGTAAPLFVFLHTYQVHSPYDPTESYRELLEVPPDTPAATSRFLLDHAWNAGATLPAEQIEAISRLYDAEIRFTDDRLRLLFADLEALGFLRDAVVIVTSDHGEEFGEHGGFLHRDLVYDVLLRVPLIMTGRGIDPGRPTELVSSVDIAPTILDVVGAPDAAAMEGSSVRRPRRRETVVSQFAAVRYALRTPRWKLIWTPRGAIELYRIGADPHERHDVAAENPDVRDSLVAALERWRRERPAGGRQRRPVELDDEDWRELEALGYVD